MDHDLLDPRTDRVIDRALKAIEYVEELGEVAVVHEIPIDHGAEQLRGIVSMANTRERLDGDDRLWQGARPHAARRNRPCLR